MVNSVSLDLRPKIALYVGFMLMISSVFFTLVDFSKDFTVVYGRIAQKYEAQYGVELDMPRYFVNCAGRDACKRVYWEAWKRSELEKATFLSFIALSFSLVGLGFFWKPDAIQQRKVRLEALRQYELPVVSSVPPNKGSV